ncbi:Discoidin domaincontaining receptor 2like, partial [Caligus rogercresseyi]
ILPGNVNTYNVANNSLLPSIFADRIRLFPYSEHTRTVCMRVELQGCPFREGVLAYSIPQGSVRGSVLELMDTTYDGSEDSLTGELSGGLGMLVDGLYGRDNFKEGQGQGWIGWKQRSLVNTFNLMFNFDTMRTFSSVDIHAHNHFSKDIAVFSKAKIYFSNEEGKFADDRVVDFKYMPDLALENARNVSINLKGEHGMYVMIQLTFEKKWILISEVTFNSEPRAQVLFTEPPPPEVYEDGGDYRDGIHLNIEAEDEGMEKGPPTETSSSDQAGILIGTLVTFIAILLAGIAYVSYRNSSRTSDKGNHHHHPILSYADTFFGSQRNGGGDSRRNHPGSGSNNNKMFFPSHQHLHQRIHETPPLRQETIYEEPSALYSAAGFLSLNRKFSTGEEPPGSEGSDDYAEPNVLLPTENPYAVLESKEPLRPLVKKPGSLPLSHYSRPLSPKSVPSPILPSNSSCIGDDGGSSSTTLRNNTIHKSNTSSSNSSSSRFSPGKYSAGGSSSSAQRQRGRNDNEEGGLPNNNRPPLSSPTSTSTSNATVTEEDYSRQRLPGTDISSSTRLYAQIQKEGSLILSMSPRPETSVDTLTVELHEIQRSELLVLEKLGEGQFGEIHLCRWREELVAVKSLKEGACDSSTRSDFEHEARILTTLTDPNLVRVLGVSFKDDVYCMICEYTERGDLYQFLQDHVAETTLSKSPGVPTLR